MVDEVQATQEVEVTAAPEAAEVADTTAQTASAPAESKPTEPDHAKETKQALKGVQKRIDELTRARYEAEERGKQEAEAARQEALYWRQQAEQLHQKIGPPKADQYPDYEQYLQATAQYEAQKVVQAQIQAERQAQYEYAQRQQVEQQRHQAAQKYNQALETKLNDAVKKFPDFIDVVSNPELPGIQGTPAFSAILESDRGAEVMYYLGKNPATAHRIASLPPLAQVKEIGRIEAAIDAGKTVTSTPPPPAKVSSGESAATKDPSRMSYDEFVAYRRKQIAAQRR